MDHIFRSDRSGKRSIVPHPSPWGATVPFQTWHELLEPCGKHERHEPVLWSEQAGRASRRSEDEELVDEGGPQGRTRSTGGARCDFHRDARL